MFTLRRRKSSNSESEGVVDRHTAQSPWYRGNAVPDLIMQEVDDKPEGYFLIRDNAGEPNCFILTYRGTGPQTRTVHITGTPESVSIAGAAQQFPNLLELVAYYSKPNDVLAGRLLPDAKTQKVIANVDKAKQKTLTKSIRMNLKASQKKGTIKRLPGAKYRPADVADLLISRGLGEYVPIVKNNKIDGVLFLSLDDAQLQELGVALPEHRQGILTLADMLLRQLDPERAQERAREREEAEARRRAEEEKKAKPIGLVAREIAGKLHFFDTETNQEIFDIDAHQARKRRELALKQGHAAPVPAQQAPQNVSVEYNEDFYGAADSVVPVSPPQPQPQEDDMYTALPQRSFVPAPVSAAPPPLAPRGQAPAPLPPRQPAPPPSSDRPPIPPPVAGRAPVPPPTADRPPIPPPASDRPPIPPPSADRPPIPPPTADRAPVPPPTTATTAAPTGSALDDIEGYGDLPGPTPAAPVAPPPGGSMTMTNATRPPPVLPPRPGDSSTLPAKASGYAQLTMANPAMADSYASLNPHRDGPITLHTDGDSIIDAATRAAACQQFPGSFALHYVHQGVVHDTILESTASGFRLPQDGGDFYTDLLSFVDASTAAVVGSLPCKLVLPRPLHAILETRHRRTADQDLQREDDAIARIRQQSRMMSSAVSRPRWDMRSASRAEALDFLRTQPPGGFVVRSSESCYAALSIRAGNGKERHMHIERATNGVYLKKHKQVFPELDALIAFYAEAERPELGIQLRP
ncbi:hypothetical protein PTSG_06738 [Salpingoeca rosetta]|uniref:SH2 domain-containing protein n=1 Tax=Salpingoeca rosetta (strain ATCC 50818 / BSB-021) TaxID=946362 RepID=F2UEN2_SALR5|nr:uncharacterized protein PTSG_06738 [Salpingoeca rosetta]EGD75082.1 hypothetical protein PTSG_06738 [Salpingoeca rosetta]|eukprot:XP_004992135.1 hypothetical protein PTSG_06738 [Salpingoeca rosetta]